jgi:guanylate kinase
LRAADGFDYIVLNTDLAKATKELKSIIAGEITNRHC